MTRPRTTTDTNRTALAVEYDAEPIRIRDPVAEALGLLEPGDPFWIDYADLVRAAGHSCPTTAGAFRIAQLGLDALYPEEDPVRSDVEVIVPGPREDPTYGVMTRLLSYVTGAAGVDGFAGLTGGYGGRRELLTFEGFDAENTDPTVRLCRAGTDETVEVSYHVGEVPDGGAALGNLRAIVDGTATDSQRQAFAEAWHGRVRLVLEDDGLFSVEN